MSRIPASRDCFRALVVALGMLLLIRDWRAESSPPADRRDSCSEALARQLSRLGADAWQRVGFKGAGVKIAVLDSGFRGYRESLGRTLPEPVAVKSFRHDGDLEARDSAHGVHCAEVIHAIAPKAALIFATWEPDDADSFLDAARWCRQQGANIISCSVIIPAFSDAEGNGSVHRELSRIFGAGQKPGDLLPIASAGNLATRHWSGRFHDGGHGRHAWRGETIDNLLTPWGNDRIFVELIGGPQSRFRVEIVDRAIGNAIGETRTYQGSDRYIEAVRFLPKSGHSYSIRVLRLTNHSDAFHLIALGAWLQHSSTAGSIMFPGDGPEWLTVGAVEADGARSTYSSCGPNSATPKPDLVAPVPFPLAGRELPFAGTSASSPQAAGLAALIWSRHPDWTARQVRDALCRSAEDINPPGHDFETGFGRIVLPPVK